MEKTQTPVQPKVVDISAKKSEALFLIKSKEGTFVAKLRDDMFVEAVEMFVVQTDRGMGVGGIFIGDVTELKGDADYNDYFLFEIGHKSMYAAEYRRITSGIVEAPSPIIKI